jgi:hypothetical protein
VDIKEQTNNYLHLSVRTVRKNEGEYYELLMNYSRKNLMLFPYHLADMVVRGLRITPFAYYFQMLEDIMLSERSYDALPNFAAADCMFTLYSTASHFPPV